MKQFTLASSYKGATDYTYSTNTITGRVQHRAERRNNTLRLPSATTEREARDLANHFNAQMSTESANEYSTILERHGAEMLDRVWKPFEPVDTVIFSVPKLGEKGVSL